MSEAPAIAPVTLYTSGMAVPAIALEVLPYGLHVNKIILNANGRSNDVICAPYGAEELVQERRMMNCIVGRYTNRLPVGTFELEKGSAKATVSPISNLSAVGLPHISLHGGPEGFDRKNWTRLPSSEARNFSDSEKSLLRDVDDESLAIFSLTSADGEEGFPGKLYNEVLFAVLPLPDEKIREETGEIELGSLIIVYRSRLLPGGASITPINLTHHWGFNFSASLQPASEPDANDHVLRVNSSKRLELGSDLMPTGNLVDNLAGSEWDWKAGKKLGDKPLQRLDGFLFFDRPANSVQPLHVPLENWERDNLLAELLGGEREDAPVEVFEEVSGVRAAFFTNQPGVQVYGGEGLRGAGTKKAIHGGKPQGSGYTGRPALFLEHHEPPNALFLSSKLGRGDGTDTILSEGEMYNNYVKVVFSYKPTQ
ncbi:galactose mutarotase-like protein [Calocera viscosa TUFC12733]|uniref:Galactose mutarotase-like protein n=1 Tax=Calocera viscosa (strain TUFC12733) TaxID=1330018 RepID=A0A167RN58_CALVF|nr:galactose mutarotase-like protein [Calocera viscosa TUFC12733]